MAGGPFLARLGVLDDFVGPSADRQDCRSVPRRQPANALLFPSGGGDVRLVFPFLWSIDRFPPVDCCG